MYIKRLFSQTAAWHSLIAAEQEALQNATLYVETMSSKLWERAEQDRLDRAVDHIREAIQAFDRAMLNNT